MLPPASGNNAGQLAVYVGGPRSTNRGSRPLTWQSNPYDAASRYQYWYADYWKPTGANGYSCNATNYTKRYQAHRWYEYLGAAMTSSSDGRLDVWTGGLRLDASNNYVSVGSSQKTISATQFTLNFNH